MRSSSALQRFMAAAARHSHFAMVGLVIGTVALMVLPVPPAALDVLIAFNIASSVLMLMLAIYIPGVLGMSTFPSLIVLTTVLRLSLNIASTKQILLHAHAGNIIETFGRIVMGGEVAVGIVVFAIVAVVQFIVISKGAERVAEVGARFTLDAIPGKQMSIEADLRGGLIDKHEARRLRSLLEQQSHMHGSMDGAMKFVKGDAIASIIIALVNIIAGIYVGSALKGMAIGDAMSRYTLLSIGDGMVSQIPSLLTSVAAAVLTTRVAGQENQPRNLATQIGQQIVAQPLALLSAGAVLLGFALVPGFPKLPFLVLGAGMSFVGWREYRRSKSVDSMAAAGSVKRKEGGEGGAAPGAAPALEVDIVVPLTLRMAANLGERVLPQDLQQALEAERERLQRELGLSFPILQVRFDPQLANDTYALDVQEIAAAPRTLRTEATDGQVPSPVAQLALAVADTVRLRTDAFVGMQEINALVKRVQLLLPDLSEEVTRAVPLQRVAEILRRLALEGVSLRYMREIYESLLVWSTREKDSAMLCEYIRMDLGRFICHRLVDDEQRLHAIIVDPPVETLVREAIKQGPSGAFVSLPPDTVRALTDQATTLIAALPAGRPAVMLTTPEVRRFLRRIVSSRLPNLHVLSYMELPQDIVVQPGGRMTVPKMPNLRVVSDQPRESSRDSNRGTVSA